MVTPDRLTAAGIRAYRELELAAQGGCCALCGETIEPGAAVLDHDHRSGQIRGVLHRFCNTFLGKIENGVIRNRITDSQLSAILKNYTDYVQELKPLLHPTHRTPEQRKIRARRRAQARRKKQKS